MFMDSEKRPTYSDVVASVMSESSDTDGVLSENYACLTAPKFDEDVIPAKILKIRKYQLHAKTYSPKWELDPNYRGWVQRSRRGDGYFYCLACNQDYTCGKSELDKHASSKKHCMNLRSLTKQEDYSPLDVSCMNKAEHIESEVSYNLDDYDASSTSINSDILSESKEESFGKYIISELKRIKKKKTYELVKWEILQTLQKAMLQEVEKEESED